MFFAAVLLAPLHAQKDTSQQILFRDAAEETGLRFHHFNGAVGEYFLPEIMGPGAALFDYDSDGDLDVYLIQGTYLDQSREPLFPPKQKLGNRLFRNDLERDSSGKPRLTFTDVTKQSGLEHEGYGMGAAVGDYDHDGHVDLYLTQFGNNVLYRNNGNGTFEDVTVKTGVDDPRWSTSAAFVDYDRDGDLDLFVTNYANYTVAGNKLCYDPVGTRDYCSPDHFRPLPDRLFRNEGNGTFVDVSESAGLSQAYGLGLGVVCADFDQDGWIDIYVANDRMANQLWMNQGNGTFEESGLFSGTAYNADGLAEASMGVSAGDMDGDGDEDIIVTHLTKETNTLYVNDGSGNFNDLTNRHGLGLSSFEQTGFGTEWFDADNDGDLDLFVANGAVTRLESLRGDPFPYHQKNQLFENQGDGNFKDRSSQSGPAFELSEISRAAAWGDIDNDGDIDVLVTNNTGKVRLLLNESGHGNHWLTVRLQGAENNRLGLGARVGVFRKGQKPLWRRAHTEGSYLSAGDPRVHFGLATAPEIERVVIHWPNGRREYWDNISADRIVTLQQNTGKSSN